MLWVMTTFGITGWLTYQFLWTYIEVVQKHDVPSLFPGDVILFLHVVPMMAALALQPDVEQHDRDLRLGSLDFALFLLWGVYLYLYSVLPLPYVIPNKDPYDSTLIHSYLPTN